MDRTIVYPGSIPLDSDILSLNRNAMLAVGALAQVALGTNVVADGLACGPTSPASLQVIVGPGSITSFGAVDTSAYGSLAADTTDAVVKMGVNLSTTTFTLTPPGGTGQAINYLIEATFGESDLNPVVLPYYNAANPSQPYSGPNNAGTAQSTLRAQRVQLRLVAGAPGVANFQATPTPDAGWFGLYVITVLNSQTTIGGGTISTYPLAPFLPYKLPQLTPGHSNIAVISTTQNWTPPFGVRLVRLRMLGGGGGGGAGGGGAGGGGAAGGSVEGYFSVTSGSPVACTIGNGGGSGSSGGASSFGGAATATGGGGGGTGAANTGGNGSNAVGIGSGIGLLLNGRAGQTGFANATLLFSGAGGASSFGDGGTGSMVGSGSNQTGTNGPFPGTGGAGGTGTGIGGTGAPGIVVLEW